MISIGLRLNSLVPICTGKVAEKVVEREMRAAAGGALRREWKLLPAPSIRSVAPIVNDHILEYFTNGSVEPVAGLRTSLPSTTPGRSASSIKLADDGTLDNIDAVIFAISYHSGYEILGSAVDPTAFAALEWNDGPYANGIAFPHLYQGLFSIVHPQKLAFIGPCRGHSVAAFNALDNNIFARFCLSKIDSLKLVLFSSAIPFI